MPSESSELTADWFTAILSQSDQSIHVDTVQVEPIGVGSGMMSGLFRVHLDSPTPAAPGSVVVKLPTRNAQNRAVAVAFDNYRREVAFYRRAAAHCSMRTPHAYWAECSAADRFVLVLEDLSAWQQGDQIAGCELNRAEAVMDALGALHASFWEQVDDGHTDWMPNNYPSVMSDGLANGTAAAWETFTTFFAAGLPHELRAAKEIYCAGLPRIQAWMNEHPRTIVHGDFRMDNLFFRDHAGHIEVACCDWQAPVRGKGIQDVAYFLSGSIDVAMRRRHEAELIQRWVDALTRQGVKGYTYAQAFEAYRYAILMLWTYVVVIGGGLAAENQRGETWVSAMVGRAAAAMTDHRCLDLL